MLGYYDSFIKKIARNNQKIYLKDRLGYFNSDRMQKIFAARVPSQQKYVLLSALVARYYWLSTPQNQVASIVLPATWDRKERQLIQRLIRDDEVDIVSKEDMKACLLNTETVFNFLATLPFPLNIKCLAEVFNDGTQWQLFFDSITPILPSVDYRGYCKQIILNHLIGCNIQAFNARKFEGISLELSILLVDLDLIGYAQGIFSLLQERDGISPKSEQWAKHNIAAVKNALRTFIDLIPVRVLRNERSLREIYSNQSAICHVLAMQTRFERVSSVTQKAARDVGGRLHSWMTTPSVPEVNTSHSNVVRLDSLELNVSRGVGTMLPPWIGESSTRNVDKKDSNAVSLNPLNPHTS
jgi:hypothetical protein